MTGEAYVHLSDEHATLTDPVLVLEGFDLDNSMNWDELYAFAPADRERSQDHRLR